MRWRPKPSLKVETLHWISRNVGSEPLLSSSTLQLPKEKQDLLSSGIITVDHSAALYCILCCLSPRWYASVQEYLDKTKKQLKPMSWIHLCVVVLKAQAQPAIHSFLIYSTWMSLSSQSSPGVVIHIAYTLFLTPSIPSLSLSINVLGHLGLVRLVQGFTGSFWTTVNFSGILNWLADKNKAPVVFNV